MVVGYIPGHPLRKFIKNIYNAHTHSVTHAACPATDAVYGEATAITSTEPSKKA